MSFPTSSFFSSGHATTSRRSSASNRTSSASSSAATAPLREVSGSLRNRENIVVSTGEIRQLFDSIKELGDIVKRQNGKMERMAARLDDTCKELSDVKAAIASDRSLTTEKDDSHRGSVPKQLKNDVHLLHNKQEIEHQFRGSESINSAHNSTVRSFLCQELQKENNDHTKSTIMRAVSRYYETKRQQYLDSLPSNRDSAEKRVLEKKLTSRRRRLFVKRMKVATESEREALEKLDPHFMSDEEDGEDDQAGLWVVRSPPWRNARLSAMIKRIQDRCDSETSTSHPKNARVQGEPSTRLPPPTSPPWAVATDIENTRPTSPSPTTDTPQSPCSSRQDSDNEELNDQEEMYRVLDRDTPPVQRRKRHRRLRDD